MNCKNDFCIGISSLCSKSRKQKHTQRRIASSHRTADGVNNKKLKALIDEKATFETFFNIAKLNPNAQLIKGIICGYRIEYIENPLTKQVRYLDKLVDELAKGRKMEKFLCST